jgi:hypothetical protein
MQVVPRIYVRQFQVQPLYSPQPLGGGIIVATLTLGSRPKKRAYKVASQEGSLGVTSHAPGSVGKVRE